MANWTLEAELLKAAERVKTWYADKARVDPTGTSVSSPSGESHADASPMTEQEILQVQRQLSQPKG